MKLLFFLSILSTFSCFVQTDDVTLSFLMSHESEPKTIGEIKGLLFGKNENKEFSFGKTELSNVHTLVTVVDFPEEIELILIKTNNDLPKNLGFYTIAVISNFNQHFSLFRSKGGFLRGETVYFQKELNI